MPELRYKRTCIKIAIAVLINTALLQTLPAFALGIAAAFEPLLGDIARSADISYFDLCYAFEETLYLFSYLASFMIPAFIFMLISSKDGREPMRLEVKITPDAPFIIIGAIGAVLTSAYLNSLMVSFIDFSPLYDDSALDTPVKVLMAFISIAIVPAVCEEFLFRGCVLSNLLPYGKTTAVVGSAVLFALMHGNFGQFFYTFIAGLVLGAVYVETGSIWVPTFIHLFNNFNSVIQQVIYERNGETAEINIVVFFIDVLLPVAALAIGAWFVYSRSKKGRPRDEAQPTRKIELENSKLVKGFLNPVMIVHIVISVGFACLIALVAIIESSGALA